MKDLKIRENHLDNIVGPSSNQENIHVNCQDVDTGDAGGVRPCRESYVPFRDRGADRELDTADLAKMDNFLMPLNPVVADEVQCNRRKGYIHRLKIDDSGRSCDDQDTLKKESVVFFQKLLNLEQYAIDPYLLDNIPSLISKDQNDALYKAPSEDEVKAVIFSMDSASAPGPNWFSGVYRFCHGSVDTPTTGEDTGFHTLRQNDKEKVKCVDTALSGVDTSPSSQRTELIVWDSVSTHFVVVSIHSS
ncbi:hypothetical protein Taro_030631 [Colocasia esculenta]|uniref:Uncharacterized protein n=1 Tax=Colocasia esculenta TaxID=4460 RepID=A0A843VSF6_COLES|nr:hypothetical protein [Colocasia esculenta]